MQMVERDDVLFRFGDFILLFALRLLLCADRIVVLVRESCCALLVLLVGYLQNRLDVFGLPVC